MATRRTTTSKQLVVNKDGSVSQGTVTFNSKGQVTKTSGGGSSSTKITQDAGLTRDQIAQRAVETTNNQFGGDPNIAAYGGEIKPGSGGFEAPATNDNYGQTPFVPEAPVEQPLTPAEEFMQEPGLAPQAVTFDSALNAEYAKRPDLQALYNPDGTAKNPNAPEVAGISTLQEWGKKYGINESPALKAAYATPQIPVEQPLDIAAELPLDPAADAATDPVDYVADVYDQVYEKLGISTLKEQIEKYNKDILDLKNEKTDKADEINNNPWYTEGKRVMELRRLDEKYEGKENNLQGYLQIATSLYNTGLSQANNMINDVNQLVSENRKQAQELVDGRYKLANGQPFYKYPGSSLVYSTATGTGLSYEQYIALGGDPNWGNIYEITPKSVQDERTLVMDMARQYDDAGILPSDSLAVAQSKQLLSPTYQKSLLTKGSTPSGSSATDYAKAYPQGSIGPGSGAYQGECGVFVRAIAGIPPVGDTVSTKHAAMNISGSEWRKQPRVGDVVSFSYNHVAVVNAVNPDGTVTFSESNVNGDKRVTHTRTLSINDPTIYGAWRGNGPVPNSKPMTSGQQLTRVKQIIATHPSEWGHAADQINAEFPNPPAGYRDTASYYDDLLKKAYVAKPKSSSSSPKSESDDLFDNPSGH